MSISFIGLFSVLYPIDVYKRQGFRRSKCVSIALKSFTAGTHSYDITSNITAIHGPIIVGTQLWFYLAQVNNVTGEINPIDYFNVFL